MPRRSRRQPAGPGRAPGRADVRPARGPRGPSRPAAPGRGPGARVPGPRPPPAPAQRTLLLLCAAEGSGSLATIARAAGDLGLEAPSVELGLEAPSVELAGDLLRVEGSIVVFRHPLVRSAVYHGAAPAARRTAHLALAAALEGRDDEADRRAWHLAQAAQGPNEEVAAERVAVAGGGGLAVPL